MNQLAIPALEAAEPDPQQLVRSADIIVINSSAGKDSQAMLDYVGRIALAEGVGDRVTVIHNDLGTTDDGEPIEWPGVTELVHEQTAPYRFPVVVTRREKGGLFQQIRAERKKFPGPGLGRWCTSDQKTDQAMKVVTRLCRQWRKERGLRPAEGRPVEVLYCLGLRAEESPGRLRKCAVEVDKSYSSSRRTITRWLPIQGWTADQVWDRIREAGTPHHPAYDQGMSRLSCALCVLASRDDLIRGVRLRPRLAAQYAALEAEIDYKFRADMSMADLISAAEGRST